jgi:hypothetical protein
VQSVENQATFQRNISPPCHVPPRRRWSFSGLHGLVSRVQKGELMDPTPVHENKMRSFVSYGFENVF